MLYLMKIWSLKYQISVWLEFSQKIILKLTRNAGLEHSKYIYLYSLNAISWWSFYLFNYTCSLFVTIQCSGYVPPEYARRGIYSTKSEVYSFGVLLLQILSGKKVSILYGENDDISLLDYVSFFNKSW